MRKEEEKKTGSGVVVKRESRKGRGESTSASGKWQVARGKCVRVFFDTARTHLARE